MRNILLIIVVIVGAFYFFIPYETQVTLLENLKIDSSFLPVHEKAEKVNEGGVINLEFDINYTAIYKGNISSGEIMKDLSWASGQFVKCFDSSKFNNFSGNMVLHRVILGKNKTASIKLIEDNTESNLSIYVYKTDAFSSVFPPEKNYTYDCKINVLPESIKKIEIKGNTITSDIVVGVSGSNLILEGGYTLEITEK